jgi:phospholipid/cholesterol/gamma-HCH transport system substrate-binding protein
MENRAHALVAGVFTLLLGLAAVLAVWWFGGKHEATAAYAVVSRHNVTGLNLQGQVRYRGIRVGKVEAIELDPAEAHNILIRISVDRRIPVTRNTIARLGYQGVTGIAHILLEDNGKDPTPLAGEGGGLPRITMQSSLIEELSEVGGATLRQARDFLERANLVLDDDNRRHLAGILGHLEATASDTREVTRQLRNLLADENLRLLSSTIARVDQAAAEAAPLLLESRRLVSSLQPVSEGLGRLIGEPSPGGIATLVTRLDEVGSELSANSRQLNRVLRMLEESPQSIVFGPPRHAPGPGEAGFVAPVMAGESR